MSAPFTSPEAAGHAPVAPRDAASQGSVAGAHTTTPARLPALHARFPHAGHEEEQALEVEALQSIFPEEFELVSAAKPIVVRVRLEPVPGEGPSKNHVGATLEVEFTDTYPETVPKLRLADTKALEEEQEKELLALAVRTAKDSVGMAMVYTICEAVKEYLVDNNRPAADGSMLGMMRERERRAEERRIRDEELARLREKEDDDRRRGRGGIVGAYTDVRDEDEEGGDDGSLAWKAKKGLGTVVTPETFAVWRAAFEAEMKARRAADLAEGRVSDLGPVSTSSRGRPVVTGKGKKGAAALGGGAAGLAGLSEESLEEVMRRKTGRELFEAGGAAFLSASAAAEVAAEARLLAAGLAAGEEEGGSGSASAAGGGGAGVGPLDPSLFLDGDDDDFDDDDLDDDEDADDGEDEDDADDDDDGGEGEEDDEEDEEEEEEEEETPKSPAPTSKGGKSAAAPSPAATAAAAPASVPRKAGRK